MKKFQFLLLDAGPIIKLFELGIWNDFIKRCDVTISRTVANQAKHASQEFEDIRIDLKPYEKQDLIRIVDVELSIVKTFYDKFDLLYEVIIHPGEKETLAFLCDSSESWQVCAADGAVFRVLGLLGKSGQGISLEEVLKEIGLSRKLEWKYSKRFREKWTHQGQIDSIQNQGQQ
ncbi:MAG TPA: hypothetical protein ENH34_05715 [Phycisphaerales bacterium]|nr:hypothetical protein [Phycisphaerales bacterium]